jgi:hypothetical protein
MEAVEREGVRDASHLYEVERRARHAERPGFRISELQIGPRQQVPWHYHSNIRTRSMCSKVVCVSFSAIRRRKCA